jgi:hypothetical protein
LTHHFQVFFGQAPDELDSHLEILAKIGNYISSDDLVDIVSNNKALKGNNFLITFYASAI